MRAYALMRQPDQLETAFLSSPHAKRQSPYLLDLRSALMPFDFAKYRGLGRYPFTEYPETEPGWQWEEKTLPDADPQARALFNSFLKPDDASGPYPRSFLDKLKDAKAVHDSIAHPESYELVELCTLPDQPMSSLGLDVGYWGGGNFSILCDVAIWPLWHPAPVEAFGELSRLLQELNSNALFSSEEAAYRYLEWYRKQTWSEPEPPEYKIISIGLLNVGGT